MKLNNRGFSAVEGVIIVVIASFVGGVGYYVYQKQGPKNSETSQTAIEQATTLPDNLENILPIEKVEELVKQSDESATIKGVELEMEDGVLVYVVKLSNGSKLAFNAQTGDKVAVSDDNDDPEEHSFPTSLTTKVTLAKAVAIAQAERPGVGIKKVEIEVEDGVLVYSVRFVDKGRVDIDANNGSIIEVRKEDGKKVKERSEKKDDDDHDNDGSTNREDSDDDNDKKSDREDRDDDNDDVNDDEDQDDDNDDVDDDEDDDNSGSDHTDSDSPEED